RNVNRIEDVAAVIYVTASNTIDIGIQRLSGRVTLLCMCTGVVGPTLLPYWSAGQLSGIAIGLKGVYDNEMMMAYGVNVRPPDGGNPRVTYTKLEGEIPPIPGYVHAGRGKTYYAALNLALTLMVLAVIVGNIAMFLAERQRKASGGRA
ncbi:MAG: hypothetical protein MH204_01465, partial [Fimbriimonadaceae bacterium]|nr:hypothetical protein [Fimbriimonadaceae bacterium]